MKETNKGITLISLVVTIVILLILASISVNAAFGNNGLITKAQEARNMTENAVKYEQETINDLLANYSNIIDDNSSNSEENELKVNLSLNEGTNVAVIIVNAIDKGDGISSIKLVNQELTKEYEDGTKQVEERFEVYENGIYEIEVVSNSGTTVNKTIEVNCIVREYVAQIGNTKYTTLTSAIKAVQEGEKTTIEIIRDFEQTVIAEIPEEKDVIIDLQNYVITMTSGSIINNGDLELKSSNESNIGKIEIQREEKLAINNKNGTMKISSGIYEATGTNNVVGNKGSSGTIIISGGEFIGSNSTVNDKTYPTLWNGANGRIIIEDGVITSTSGSAVLNDGDGEITINGGQITATNNDAIRNKKNGKIIINGGNIKSEEYSAVLNSSTGSVEITNGTLQADKFSTILNEGSGTITIKNGQINGTTVEGEEYPTIWNMSNGNIQIDGGTVISEDERAIYNSSNGNIIISNGTIQAIRSNTISNYGSGTVTITGGTIKGIEVTGISYPTVWNEDNGKIIMSGGLIDATICEGTSPAVNNEGSGDIIITGGTIKSNGNAIKNQGTGVLTLGIDDGNINTTTPEIIATNEYYTISGGTDSKLNFYDGVIKGAGISTKLVVTTPSGKSYSKDTSKTLYETILK